MAVVAALVVEWVLLKNGCIVQEAGTGIERGYRPERRDWLGGGY
jgi:hypothetical protein